MPLPATPALTTDCVVFDKRGNVLLIRRKHDPFKGSYALPGGFVEVGELVEDACRRELKEETGLDVGALRLIGVYSDPNRDPRGHTCSIAYLAHVGRAEPRAATMRPRPNGSLTGGLKSSPSITLRSSPTPRN